MRTTATTTTVNHKNGSWKLPTTRTSIQGCFLLAVAAASWSILSAQWNAMSTATAVLSTQQQSSSSSSSSSSYSAQAAAAAAAASAAKRKIPNADSDNNNNRTIEELFQFYNQRHRTQPKNVTQLIWNHIDQLVQHVQYPLSESYQHCSNQIQLRVDRPGTPPTSIRAVSSRSGAAKHLQRVLERHIFPSLLPPKKDDSNLLLHHTHSPSSRALPFNVSLGIRQSDFVTETPSNHHRHKSHRCFGYSSPGGFFTVPNFDEMARWHDEINGLQEQRDNSTRRTDPSKYQFPWTPFPQKPHRIPVFRGVGWSANNGRFGAPDNPDALRWLLQASAKHRKRLHLVVFSQQHPDLVNAGIVGKRGIPPAFWQHNATNGLHQLLPFDPIPKTSYFTDYQVAVVMGGIGAAFRTPLHLQQQQAVILQDFIYEEWYVRFMTPYVHYIPLAEDISNLQDILVWVQRNPGKVQKIAEQGQQFHQDFLSWTALEDFYYRLLYQLATREREYHVQNAK